MRTPLPAEEGWRQKIWEVIFLADTPGGKWFDLALLWAIVLSVLIVVLDSVNAFHDLYGNAFLYVEWLFTIIFSTEYALRILCVRRKMRYIFSFWGLIDLIALIPAYLSIFFAGTHSLLIVRGLRLLRIFRVLRLVKFSRGANLLMTAVAASRYKIMVFLSAIICLVLVLGTLMYLVEGPEHGFTSIPKSVYWAIVTITTVGYGDLVPQTVFGQIVSSIAMILGYGVIAVPTGIMSVEIAQATRQEAERRKCQRCEIGGHLIDAAYCRKCGERLKEVVVQ